MSVAHPKETRNLTLADWFWALQLGSIALKHHRDPIPHTSKEGSTRLAGIDSRGSEGVHMSLCTAWGDGPQTSPGGLLASGQLSC